MLPELPFLQSEPNESWLCHLGRKKVVIHYSQAAAETYGRLLFLIMKCITVNITDYNTDRELR